MKNKLITLFNVINFKKYRRNDSLVKKWCISGSITTTTNLKSNKYTLLRSILAAQKLLSKNNNIIITSWYK